MTSIVDNFTDSERKRRQLIEEIHNLHKSGVSVSEISRITGKNWKTVKKYLDGDPDILCRSNRRSELTSCIDKIIKSIKDGMTASTIAKQLQAEGYEYTSSNIRHYVKEVAE